MPSITLPKNPNLYDLFSNETRFKSALDTNVSSSPALNVSFLTGVIAPLKLTDSGMLKNVTIQYTYKGKIVKLDTDATSTYRGVPDTKHLFLLSLANEKTGVVVTVDAVPNNIINPKEIKVWSKLDSLSDPKLITLSDLKMGDLVEVFESVDLLNEKLLKEEITLLSQGN